MAMITDFIDSVVIIDDKEEEIKKLAEVLLSEDISVKIQLVDPQDKQMRKIVPLKKYRQLIFVDLSLDDSIDVKTNISTEIRPILSKILPKTKGCYGLVVWSKHVNDDMLILKEKLLNDNEKYCLPMFIISLDKSKYLRDGYENILNDLDYILQSEKSAYFFVYWMNTVKSASNKAISDIYSLVPNYEKQNTELVYILYKMALNHSGIPEEKIKSYDLMTDAYKAFDELLYSDLINQLSKSSTDIFNQIPQNPYNGQKNKENEIYSELNSKLFIDEINKNQNVIIPGNVYEIVNPSIVKPGLPNNVDVEKYIAIELTPPCDFSQRKKVNSRLIKGFLCNIKYKEKFKKEYYYKDMFPLKVGNIKNLQFVLDFRYLEVVEDSELTNESNYKVLFKVTPKLFADILQKFSSSYGRLGLSNIKQ